MKNTNDAFTWFDRIDDVGIRLSDRASHYTRLGKEVRLASVSASVPARQSEPMVQILQDFFVTPRGIEEDDVSISVFVDGGTQLSAAQARELAAALVALADEIDARAVEVSR